MLGVWVGPDLLAAIDEARGPLPRALFVRMALVEYCRQRGIDLPDKSAAAPDRAKKRANIDIGARALQVGLRARQLVTGTAPPLRTVEGGAAAAGPAGGEAVAGAPLKEEAAAEAEVRPAVKRRVRRG